MKTTRQQDLVGSETPSRREFLARSVVAAATILLYGGLGVAAAEKTTFTILHTNDLHSNFIGLGPASDYTPFSIGDDKTLGGYARLGALIRQRKEQRENWPSCPRTRKVSPSMRRPSYSTILAATRPTCFPRRARWIKVVSTR
jgi:hypothetical protein